MRPRLGLFELVNHSAPSGPAVMLCGLKLDVTGNCVIVPLAAIRPMASLTAPSVNHMAPSGPSVIPEQQPESGLGRGYSVTTPAVVIRPMAFASVNQSAPSGPFRMPPRPATGVGTRYSVTAPAVVMRPIIFVPRSVNHNAPSGPLVMNWG